MNDTATNDETNVTETNGTIERTEAHATFVIERTYPVPVEAVWHALSDNDARDQWFGAGEAFDTDDKSHEFPCRRARHRGRPVARRPPVQIPVHLRRHRRPAADDRVHLRHVGQQAAPVHVCHHDRAGTGMAPGPGLRTPSRAPTSTAWTAPEGREAGARGLLDQLGSYLTSGR